MADHVTYVRNFTDVDDKINARAAYSGRDISFTDEAINISDHDDSKIEEAVKRAQDALTEGKKSNLDLAAIQKLEAAARFALAQQVAKGKSR